MTAHTGPEAALVRTAARPPSLPQLHIHPCAVLATPHSGAWCLTCSQQDPCSGSYRAGPPAGGLVLAQKALGGCPPSPLQQLRVHVRPLLPPGNGCQLLLRHLYPHSPPSGLTPIQGWTMQPAGTLHPRPQSQPWRDPGTVQTREHPSCNAPLTDPNPEQSSAIYTAASSIPPTSCRVTSLARLQSAAGSDAVGCGEAPGGLATSSSHGAGPRWHHSGPEPEPQRPPRLWQPSWHPSPHPSSAAPTRCPATALTA